MIKMKKSELLNIIREVIREEKPQKNSLPSTYNLRHICPKIKNNTYKPNSDEIAYFIRTNGIFTVGDLITKFPEAPVPIDADENMPIPSGPQAMPLWLGMAIGYGVAAAIAGHCVGWWE